MARSKPCTAVPPPVRRLVGEQRERARLAYRAPALGRRGHHIHRPASPCRRRRPPGRRRHGGPPAPAAQVVPGPETVWESRSHRLRDSRTPGGVRPVSGPERSSSSDQPAGAALTVDGVEHPRVCFGRFVADGAYAGRRPRSSCERSRRGRHSRVTRLSYMEDEEVAELRLALETSWTWLCARPATTPAPAAARARSAEGPQVRPAVPAHRQAPAHDAGRPSRPRELTQQGWPAPRPVD